MANAIHKTTASDTLASIAGRYYALEGPHGTIRDVELKKVTNAIREATPTALKKFKDADPLPEGTTLFIPTLRELNRVVFSDRTTLMASLKAHGYEHARKLLRYSADEVIGYLSPLPPDYSAADIRRTWMLTALLNLDGMDLYTAQYLYDTVRIVSLPELANQSQATIDSALATLIAAQHFRPPELAKQRHAERWIMGAKIQVRGRIGELTKIKGRFFQVPCAPATAQSQAEFYEAAALDAASTRDEASLACRLGKLYRFQAAVLRGNFGLRSRNWGEAIAGYQEARRHWHRLAEEIGAELVNDDDGLNLKTCIDITRRLLESLPSEEEVPLGAPPIKLRRRGGRARYRLRGFRYDELAPNRKQELRNSLSATSIHRFSRKLRSAIHRATLEKTRLELKNADAALITGLTAGADTTLARDFDQKDRDLLRRNLGGVPGSALFEGAAGLNLFESLGSDLAIADVSSVVSDLWNAATPTAAKAAKAPAADILSDAARASYPSDFVNRKDVTPFTKFLVLPGEKGRAGDRLLPLNEAFAEEYENQLLKPRLMSGEAEDLLFDEEAWANAGAFAAIVPYIYATQIPLGLRQAYGRTGQMGLARKFGGQRISFYKSDGTAIRNVIAATPSSLAFDPDLLACSTNWEPAYGVAQELEFYALTWIPLADFDYRKDRTRTARSKYADVKCAIEQAYPEFADEARLGLTGVYNTIQAVNLGTFVGSAENRNLATLTTLNVEYVRDGTVHQVMDGMFLPIKTSLQGKTQTLSAATATLSQYFEWNGLVDIDSGETKTAEEAVEEYLDDETSGASVSAGDVEVYVDHSTGTQPIVPGKDEFYRLYLYCEAQINAIDAGLNWYGYGDEFVPCWAFEHLYDVSRDLCNRALDAEQRVFSLLQLYETALTQEFLATQQDQLAGAELSVAKAQVAQQIASNHLAAAQASFSEEQAQAQENKSQVEAIVAVSNTVIQIGATVFGLLGGGPAGAVAMGKVASGLTGQNLLQSGESTAIAVNNHIQDKKVLNAAIDVTTATANASAAGLSVAIAEQDVASLQTEQASAYVDFLLSKDLNSDAYLYLMGRAKEILEVYIHHANRMAWLAERALEHETRQSYDLIQTDYTINDGLADMTRAQQLTADLETLRSEYVAGQTARLQEVKWTVDLSQIDPIAWRDLRETGRCTFILRQRALDMDFPGMYQHRLKDIRLEIVGLVPPEGARGVLNNPGVSWVRVPNEQSFLAGQTKDDWVTTSLAKSTTFAQYDEYVIKRLLTNVVTVTLSQFDVRADRVVLAAPQGMLKPVEHQGLDAAWTLTLHRQSNNFDFKNIVDVEFTFWFLAAYDPGLEQAEENALTQEGLQGDLNAAARTAFTIDQPDAWAAFVGESSDPDALDLRYLTVDVTNLPLWAKERKLTNILFGCARAASQSNEITLRLCCQYDPVGFLLTTKNGAVYSLIGIDTSGEVPPPKPDLDFEAWVKKTFYLQIEVPEPPLPSLPGPSIPSHKVSIPIKDPQARWVIKAAPAQVGSGWLKEDEDGNGISTSSGPLLGVNHGTATYRDGTTWTNYSFQVKVAHRKGTLRLLLRDDGANHYALQISPTDLKLFRVVSGVNTQLGSALSYTYPAGEYLWIDARIVHNSLTVAIDGLTLFDNIDGAPTAGQLQTGTVAIQVLNGTQPVAFDDAKVVRLTGLGAEAETLLSEPFTKELPQDWVFVDGDSPWSIAPEGHSLLDLSSLLNSVLSLDYRYQMNLN
jgi:Tc toxin complex TcA C-terminal TcB-binding domain